MSRFTKNLDRPRKFFLDQNIVRIVGRDGENRDVFPRERLDESKQYSGLRKRKWAFELQANPVM